MSDSINLFWNRCRAALLTDAYLQIQNGEINQNEAVENLINGLSVVANRLRIPDEDMIGDNEIRIRLRYVGYFVSNGKLGLANHDYAIENVVRLYQQSQPSYLLLLHKARTLANPNTKPSKLFFALMEARASDRESMKIHSLLLSLDRYCYQKGITKRSLREATELSEMKSVIGVMEREAHLPRSMKKEIASLREALNENASLFKEVLYKVQKTEAEPTLPVSTVELSKKLTMQTVVSGADKSPSAAPRTCRPCASPQNKAVSEEDSPMESVFSNQPINDKTLSPQLLEILADKDMLLLRQTLIREGILTLEQFQSVNPWVFMNRYALYTIGQRQNICTRITNRLKGAESKKDGQSGKYKLVIGSDSYSGETSAEAFVSFCERMVQKYPLKFRSLLDSSCEGTIALSRTSWKTDEIKMMNPVAFVRRDLTPQQIIAYVRWMCAMFGDTPCSAEIVEPEPNSEEVPETLPQPMPASEDTSKNEPSPPAVQPAVPAETISQAEALVLKADIDGMSIDELSQRLGTTKTAAKDAVAASNHLATLCERLYHDEAFVDWEEGANQLEQILEKLLIRNDGYASAAQLYDFARMEMPIFLNDNGIDNPRIVYDLAQHLFEKVRYHGKQFVFRSKAHISSKENAVSSNLDIMRGYAVARGGFVQEEELVQYLQSAGVKTGNLRGQMQVYSRPIFLFYAPGQFLYAPSMDMDDHWFSIVKDALDKLFEDMGDHMVLRDIRPWWYAQLPALPGGRLWTPLLLQSVLFHFGEKLDGAHTIEALSFQTGDTLHAMLASGDSGIQTFADAVAAYLIDEEIPQRNFEAEELRQLLVHRGMIAGGELMNNMPKALSGDARFAWDADGKRVVVRV